MVSGHASPLTAPGGRDAGGQNVHVAELSRALGAAGHEVTVWTRRDAPALPDAVPSSAGVVVRHLDAGPPVPLADDRLVPHLPQLAAALERAWAARRPDVVHAHFWTSGLAAIGPAARIGVPVVQTFHDLGASEHRNPGRRSPVEQVVGRRVARVIATYRDEAVELARMGVPRGNVTVVPGGVDVDVFTPDGPVAGRVPGTARLVSVGQLVRRKGVDELIGALRRLPATELVVAGGAPAAALDDDPDVHRLRTVATACGVADRVRFLGSVARPEVAALLRSADVVVCAPWYEAFGRVAVEAMACGRPVVATAVGGLTDTVVEDVTGVHVAPQRSDQLAVTLRRLLARPAMAEAFGLAGHDRAVACYPWTRVAAAVAGVYGGIAAAA